MKTKIFFDTAPLIYLLDNSPLYFNKMIDFVSNCDRSTKFYTSVITDLEYKVIPQRTNDIERIEIYENFLKRLKFKKNNIDSKIINIAIGIRSKYSGIKGLDSLQIASAINSRCDIFLTNDKQLLQVSEIKSLLVDNLQ